MFAGLVMAVIFLILGIILLMGKAKWLTVGAGYNTMTQEQRNQYDPTKIGKISGAVCIVCAIMITIMSVVGARVDAGLMPQSALKVCGVIFVIVIIATIFSAIYFINTKGKKKTSE